MKQIDVTTGETYYYKDPAGPVLLVRVLYPTLVFRRLHGPSGRRGRCDTHFVVRPLGDDQATFRTSPRRLSVEAP